MITRCQLDRYLLHIHTYNSDNGVTEAYSELILAFYQFIEEKQITVTQNHTILVTVVYRITHTHD